MKNMENNHGQRGFTLLEILVAAVILVLLGGSLVGALRSTMGLWRTGERNRAIFDQAQNLVENFIVPDLSAMYANPSPAIMRTQGWLLADYDQFGRKRLRFIVAPQEGLRRECPFNTLSRMVQPTAGADYFTDLKEVPYKLGGEMFTSASLGSNCPLPRFNEVIYICSADAEGNTLYRFELSYAPDLFDPPGRLRAVPEDAIIAEFGSAIPNDYGFEDLSAQGDGSYRVYNTVQTVVALSHDVVYFDVLFWGQDTQTWDEAESVWDSTRTTLDFNACGEDFSYTLGERSLNDWADDVFPSRVKVVLTVRDQGNLAGRGRLLLGITDGSGTLELESTAGFPPSGFCKIDGEWMEYSEIQRSSLIIKQRGARHTKAVGHQAGKYCEVGVTFEAIIELPCYREDLNDR